MNHPPVSEHAWFRRHLPDHLLDLLVDGDRTRFDRHARSCATCARLLASATGARADWWDGAGHPPVDMLLAWDAAAAADREHDAVRAHLAACESCRHDLEDLRGAEVARAIALVPALPGRPRRARPSLLAWAPAASAAAGLLAVAAAVYFLRSPAGREVAPPPAIAPPATAPPAPGATAVTPPAAPAGSGSEARAGTAEPVALASAERGAPAAATLVEVATGIVRIPLTLPTLLVPEDATLSLELRDAAGAVAWRQALPARHALRAGGVVLPAAALASGAYVLRVGWTDPALGESSREFALDVRTSR